MMLKKMGLTLLAATCLSMSAHAQRATDFERVLPDSPALMLGGLTARLECVNRQLAATSNAAKFRVLVDEIYDRTGRANFPKTPSSVRDILYSTFNSAAQGTRLHLIDGGITSAKIADDIFVIKGAVTSLSRTSIGYGYGLGVASRWFSFGFGRGNEATLLGIDLRLIQASTGRVVATASPMQLIRGLDRYAEAEGIKGDVGINGFVERSANESTALGLRLLVETATVEFVKTLTGVSADCPAMARMSLGVIEEVVTFASRTKVKSPHFDLGSRRSLRCRGEKKKRCVFNFTDKLDSISMHVVQKAVANSLSIATEAVVCDKSRTKLSCWVRGNAARGFNRKKLAASLFGEGKS